jgi:hypothetical protein
MRPASHDAGELNDGWPFRKFDSADLSSWMSTSVQGSLFREIAWTVVWIAFRDGILGRIPDPGCHPK